jgi:hypothetical protein
VLQKNLFIISRLICIFLSAKGFNQWLFKVSVETTYCGSCGILIALIINDMGSANKKITTFDPDGKDSARSVFCNIFSDWVSPHLCDIRRKELIAQGTFSCADCSIARGDASAVSR